jgi:hypothetical protein
MDLKYKHAQETNWALGTILVLTLLIWISAPFTVAWIVLHFPLTSLLLSLTLIGSALLVVWRCKISRRGDYVPGPN